MDQKIMLTAVVIAVAAIALIFVPMLTQTTTEPNESIENFRHKLNEITSQIITMGDYWVLASEQTSLRREIGNEVGNGPINETVATRLEEIIALEESYILEVSQELISFDENVLELEMIVPTLPTENQALASDIMGVLNEHFSLSEADIGYYQQLLDKLKVDVEAMRNNQIPPYDLISEEMQLEKNYEALEAKVLKLDGLIDDLLSSIGGPLIGIGLEPISD